MLRDAILQTSRRPYPKTFKKLGFYKTLSLCQETTSCKSTCSNCTLWQSIANFVQAQALPWSINGTQSTCLWRSLSAFHVRSVERIFLCSHPSADNRLTMATQISCASSLGSICELCQPEWKPMCEDLGRWCPRYEI